MRIARVHDERYAHRFEAAARQLRARRARRRGQRIARHVGKTDASTLDQFALFENLRDAFPAQRSASRTLPGVGRKRRAVERADGLGKAGLQSLQIAPNGCRIEARSVHSHDLRFRAR